MRVYAVVEKWAAGLGAGKPVAVAVTRKKRTATGLLRLDASLKRLVEPFARIRGPCAALPDGRKAGEGEKADAPSSRLGAMFEPPLADEGPAAASLCSCLAASIMSV